MGWTGIRDYGNEWNNFKKIKDRKNYLDNLWNNERFCTWNGSEFVKTTDYCEIAKSSMVGSVYYAALKRVSESGEIKEIFCEVILTSVKQGEFCYKEMDETMLPFCYDCPISILKILTPTKNKYANEWRKRCWTMIRKRKLLRDAEKHDYIINSCGHDLKYSQCYKKWILLDNLFKYEPKKRILNDDFVVIVK